MKREILLAALLIVSGAATRADVLDGLIFGIKCAGAADRQACEEQAKREADQARERMRQQSQLGDAGGAPALGPPGADATQGQEVHRNWVKNVVCHQYAKRSSRDVDTTYARAMSRYGFITRSEAKRLPVRDEFNLHAAGYLHDKTAGALYRLEQVVSSSDVDKGRRQYKLLLDLARDGAGTRINGRYCVTTDDPAGWQDLPAKIRASLDNTF